MDSRAARRGTRLLATEWLVVLCATLPASLPALQPDVPAWMEGCWEQRRGTTVVREQWRRTPTGLDGGTATWSGETLRAWEFLRVNSASGYTAAPNGQAAHSFALVSANADSAQFTDPAHDFPQRLLYRRIGDDSLHIEVSASTPQPRGFVQPLGRVACDPGQDLTAAVRTRARLQQALDSIQALGSAPGLSAAVALPDGRTITVTSGVADSAGMVPLQPTHRLLAGSTGKTFFAALALQLVSRDSLDLDAKISTWLGSEPWFPKLPNGADITVRQLMSHTSGLVRYEFDPEFVRDLTADPLRDWQVDEQLAYVLGDEPPFAAGAGWEYSDTNFIVLALILERIIDGTAYEAIAERFVGPLRLRGTVPSTSPRIPGLANGYTGPRDPLGFSGAMLTDGALRMNPAFEWAGGGYASTPEDLARWAQAWYRGELFGDAVLAEALTGNPSPPLGRGVQYGLGVIISPTSHGTAYGHSGFFPGYLTEMRYYPDSEVGVSVMTNTSNGRAIGRSPGSIADVLAGVVLAGGAAGK